MLHYVVIGGGVAGVCCVEELCRVAPESRITLISVSQKVKGVANFVKVSDALETFDIVEQDIRTLSSAFPNVSILTGEVSQLRPGLKQLVMKDGTVVHFDKVCICAGAAPNLAFQHERVIGLRDTETVEHLAELMRGARRVVIVGNGGIALGLVHELVDVDLVWAMRSTYIGNTYFDASASRFFLDTTTFQWAPAPPESPLPDLSASSVSGTEDCIIDPHDDLPLPSTTAEVTESVEFVPTYAILPPRASKRRRKAAHDHPHNDEVPVKRAPDEALEAISDKACGASLGPAWVQQLRSTVPRSTTSEGARKRVMIETRCELRNVIDHRGSESEWPISAVLSNGRTYPCDFIISATGLLPAVSFVPAAWNGIPFQRHLDGGLLVNRWMQTTGCESVYAAGDAASVLWPRLELDSSSDDDVPLWFQMRLWNQARVQGTYAARCMAHQLDPLELEAGGLHFQLFAHMTKFLGFKVVLLGLYNGQGLHEAYQAAIATHLARSPDCLVEEGPVSRLESERASDVQIQFRITPGVEYVKIVLFKGRVVGAILIGETDLEEAIENLILNRLHMSTSHDGASTNMLMNLLDPDIDIEEFFD